MGSEIDRLEIEVEVAASNANKQLDLMIEKLSKVSKTLCGIDLGNIGGASDYANKAKNFSNTMYAFATRTSSTNSQLKKLTSSIGGYIQKTTVATNKSKKLSQAFGSVYASFFPIIRAAKSTGKAIESSMDYIETYNYFNVTMSKIGKEFSNQYKKYGYESADAYIDSFTGRLNDQIKKMTGYSVESDGVLTLSNDMNLGLDPNQLMNYQASVSAVTNSLGLCGETSVNTSKALSMLASDLSSFKNVDIKTVMTNMQSGLIGQSRALYKYGIDITNATLQTYAYKYGIATAVSEMTQADKMQLRLLAILDQSKIAWGDQANTINSVANQYRIFKQQIQNVARLIGSLLMPAVKAVLPWVNGLLIATQRLIGFIGGLFGIDFGKIMDGISSGYSGFDTGDLVDDTEDVADNLGKASNNAKKMKSSLLGIDELNVIQPDDNSDSGNAAGTASGSGGIDLSNEIASAVADYEAVWNEAFENSANKAQEYADKITKVFSNMWGMIKSGDYEGLGEYIAGGVDLVFEKINSVFNWNKTGPSITEFVDGYCRAVNSLVDNVDWQNIGKTIGDGINVITNTMYLYLTGIDWVNFGVALATGLNGMVESVDWEILGRTIGAWIMKIPEIVYGFVTTLNWSSVGNGIGIALNGVLMEFDGKTIAGGINGIVNGMLTTLKNFIKTVDWSEVAKAVGDVLGNLDWGTLAGIGLALGAVKLVGNFVSTLAGVFSKKIREFIEGNLLSGLSDIAKAFEDDGIVGKGIALFGSKLSTVFSAFTGISVPANIAFAGFVGGIALVVAGIVDLWNTSETFRDNVSNMLSILGAAFESFKKSVWDEGLKPLWDSICELFGSMYEVYESSGLKTVFESVITTLGYIASGVLGGLIAMVGNLIEYFAGVAKTVVDLLNFIVRAVNAFAKDHEKTINGLKKIFGGFTEFLAGVFSGDWKRAFDGIKTMASGFKDTIQDTFERLWKKIKSVFSPVKDFFKGAFEGAYNAVTKIWDGIGKYFKNIANTIIEPIGKVVNGVIGGVNWVLGKLGSKDTISEWVVPQFANGSNGIQKDTFGMVNDQKGATYRELVVPPNGKPFIPKGRNVMLPLQRGTKIMPADETKAFMSAMPHFASGIGDFFGKAWTRIKDFTGDIFDYASNPDKIMQIALDKFVDVSGWNGVIGDIAGGLVNTVFGSAVNYVKNLFGSSVMERAIKWAVGIANDNSHGYDQAHRTGPDYDCSSLITTALKKAGLNIGVGTTSTMYSQLTSAGFKNVAGSVNMGNSAGMRRGDVLLAPGQHTALYLGNGKMVHARINEFGRITGGKPGDQTGNEIAVTGYSNHPWTYVLRYMNGYMNGIGKIRMSDFIPALSDGGVLRRGQMFIARERGPELVGSHNGKSTVMNNDQIVKSVSNGVESAVERQNAATNALLKEIAEYQKMLLKKDTSVNIDGKKADKQISKARRNSGYSFSPA